MQSWKTGYEEEGKVNETGMKLVREQIIRVGLGIGKQGAPGMDHFG